MAIDLCSVVDIWRIPMSALHHGFLQIFAVQSMANYQNVRASGRLNLARFVFKDINLKVEENLFSYYKRLPKL